MEKLAINGGRKAVPDGTVKNWPPIDNVDRKRVLASLEGGNHAFGDNCAAFQNEFAAWNGNKFAVATNSGTAALHMALVACDVRLRRRGHRDGLLLVLLRHLHPPPQRHPGLRGHRLRHDQHGQSLIERAITKKTKAIIAVHLHGLPMNMEKVMAIARRHNLKVDRGRLPGARGDVQGAQGRHVGTLRRFQFQPEQMPLRGRGRDVRHRR